MIAQVVINPTTIRPRRPQFFVRHNNDKECIMIYIQCSIALHISTKGNKNKIKIYQTI
jgi:hypothetical protein